MMTIDIKVNGETVAEARFVSCGEVVNDGTQITDDYDVQWIEEEGEGLAAVRDAGGFFIKGHGRHQTHWALVAKAAAAILGQKIEAMEGKG